MVAPLVLVAIVAEAVSARVPYHLKKEATVLLVTEAERGIVGVQVKAMEMEMEKMLLEMAQVTVMGVKATKSKVKVPDGRFVDLLGGPAHS